MVSLRDLNERHLRLEQDYELLGTEHQRTEDRLYEKEQMLEDSSKRLGQLAAIVESSDDVIVSKDLDGIIRSWNASAARLFGYSADEMIGKSILKLIPEDFTPMKRLSWEISARDAGSSTLRPCGAPRAANCWMSPSPFLR